MEFEEFQSIALGFLSRERFQESSEAIEDLIQSDYPRYINLLLQLIEKFDNQRLFNVSITLFQVEVRQKRLFENPEAAIFSIEKLTSLFPQILLSTNIQDNFKKNMAFILAQMQIFLYKKENSIIFPSFILNAYKEKVEIRKYLIYCIFEAALNDDTLGGFKVDDLLPILTDSKKDDGIFMSKINLFFAVAMRRPDIKSLQEIFPELISSCPDNDLDEMLLSLSEFSEKSSSFFRPYLGALVQRLCEIATNTTVSNSVRNKSILCLVSIAEGSPEMCQYDESYYAPVFESLIKISSEINDGSPWEYDTNNTSPYQTALDSIGVLANVIELKNIFSHIYQLVVSYLSKDNVTWQIAYASISALSCIDLESIYNREFFEIISMFLNMDCHPRVRIAAYHLIYYISNKRYIYPNQSEEIDSLVIIPLETLMINENSIIGKKMAYKAYTEFFSQIFSRKSPAYFMRMYPYIINEIRRSPDDFLIYIIRVIGPLYKSAPIETTNRYFQDLLRIIIYLFVKNDPNIKAETIVCFYYVVSNYNLTNDSLIQFACRAVDAGLSLLELNIVNEKTLDSLYEVLTNLVCKLKGKITNITQKYYRSIIEDCSKYILVEETSPFDSNETFRNTSLYLKISPSNSPINQYVLTSDVNKVANSLSILRSFIITDNNFMNYIEDVYTVIENLLMNKYRIELIQEQCWTIFHSIFHCFDILTIDINPKYIETLIRCYCFNIKQITDPSLINNMLSSLISAIIYAQKIKWYDPDLFNSILQTIQPLIDNIIEKYQHKYQNLIEFGETDFRSPILSKLKNCLEEIPQLLSNCFKLQPLATNDLYNRIIEPNIDYYLSNSYTYNLGILLRISFIISNKDVEKMISFSEILIEKSNEFNNEDDMSMNSLYALGELLYKIPLNNNAEYINHFIDFFRDYFRELESHEENDEITNISDYANIAFGKFILTNIEYLDPVSTTEIFMDAMPLWYSSLDDDVYFQCMNAMLQKNWFELICGTRWPSHILGNILTAIISDMCKKSTIMLLANTLRNFYRNPEIKESIDYVLQFEISPDRAAIFYKYVKPTE